MEKGEEFHSFVELRRTEKALSPLDFSRDFGAINNSWVEDLSNNGEVGARQ